MTAGFVGEPAVLMLVAFSAAVKPTDRWPFEESTSQAARLPVEAGI
jgi:hypothetical protein